MLSTIVRALFAVLAIGRGEHGVATPSPTDPLRAGDVLALAGSEAAITAAREMLSPVIAEPAPPG